jgi:hypothetical protein
VFLIFLQSTFAFALPTAKYTLKIINEDGLPVHNADANVSFMKSKPGGWGGQTYFVEGKTNFEGVFVAEGNTQQTGAYGAGKDGYYYTRYDYKGLKEVSGVIGFRRWEPWNPTLDVVIKQIKKPIAMHAYNTEWIDIPVLAIPIGYDLLKRDWVAPYGNGLTEDLVFELHKNVVSGREFDAELRLSFSNVGDGIQPFYVQERQGSNLRSAHEAPITGYKDRLEQKRFERPNVMVTNPYREDANYYFRVQCTESEEDTCLYGKIYGNIEIGGVINNETGQIKFTYYLNATSGDQNIEFDPKKNKFKLPRNSKISRP